jgi:hypothetical protein
MTFANGARAGGLRRVVYVSDSNPALNVREIPRIATRSRAHNREQGITGVLLYTGNRFAGVIEGSPVDVARLLDNLLRDMRHGPMRVVLDIIDAGTRWFADWGMGFLYSPVESKRIDALIATTAGARPQRPGARCSLAPTRSEQLSGSALLERAHRGVGCDGLRLDAGHPRRRRPAPAPRDDALDRLRVTLHVRLDGAVAPVAHPAGHARFIRDGLHRRAIAHALHVAADDHVKRDDAAQWTVLRADALRIDSPFGLIAVRARDGARAASAPRRSSRR